MKNLFDFILRGLIEFTHFELNEESLNRGVLGLSFFQFLLVLDSAILFSWLVNIRLEDFKFVLVVVAILIVMMNWNVYSIEHVEKKIDSWYFKIEKGSREIYWIIVLVIYVILFVAPIIVGTLSS